MLSKRKLQTLHLAGYIVLMISGFLTIIMGILQRSDLEPMQNKEILLEIQMDEHNYSNLSSVLHDVLVGNTFQGVITMAFSTVFPCIFWKRNSQLFLTFCLSLTPVLLFYQGILLDMWIGIKNELDCCTKEVHSQNFSEHIVDIHNNTSTTDHQCIHEQSARNCFYGYVMWINKWYISCFSLATVQISIEVLMIFLVIILLRQDEKVKCLPCSSRSRLKRQRNSASSWIFQDNKQYLNERRSSLPKRQSVRIIIATDRHIYSGLNVFTIDV